MRKIREILRPKAEGFSDRQIAASIGSAWSTVQDGFAVLASRRHPAAGSGDVRRGLQERMYRREAPLSRTPRPEFAYLHAKLRRRGVARLLLWEDYTNAHPDGWRYSVCLRPVRRWLATQELVLRQDHPPGDKLFVVWRDDLDASGHWPSDRSSASPA